MTLKLGCHDQNKKSEGEQLVEVDDVVYHDGFDDVTMNNDIAVMKLARPVPFSDTIRPVCLPKPGQFFQHGTHAIVAGWGAQKGMLDIF